MRKCSVGLLFSGFTSKHFRQQGTITRKGTAEGTTRFRRIIVIAFSERSFKMLLRSNAAAYNKGNTVARKKTIEQVAKQLELSYQRFPLWLLEYGAFTKSAVKTVEGPFCMHCLHYLHGIATIGGVEAAVEEFSEQLGDRICGLDYPEKTPAYHVKAAKKWLQSMLESMRSHASKPLQRELLLAIESDMNSKIDEAYAEM